MNLEENLKSKLSSKFNLSLVSKVNSFRSDEVLTKAFSKVDVGKTSLKEVLGIDLTVENIHV